ncbi:MAG: aspartate 1-decarboxylase [Microcoleaceae cyanobacterium]
MQRTLLLAKIHNCTLTGTNLEYVGSISVDQSLLDAAGICAYEQVQVVNISNGERLITYIISAPANSGTIELNGAAARLGMPGDRIIIMSYGQFLPEEVQNHHPTVILVNQQNQMIQAHPNNELN